MATSATPGRTAVRRRRAVLLVALLLAGVAAAVLALRGPGEKSEESAGIELPEPADSLNDPRTGISLRWPAGWEPARRSDAIRVKSSDRRALIVVTALPEYVETGEHQKPELVLADTLREITSTYSDVSVDQGAQQGIAGLPTRSAIVSGRNSKGSPLRILVAAAEGHRRPYVVTVFTAEDAPDRRFVEAQLILASIRLEA
jgi:hypothetical protein